MTLLFLNWWSRLVNRAIEDAFHLTYHGETIDPKNFKWHEEYVHIVRDTLYNENAVVETVRGISYEAWTKQCFRLVMEFHKSNMTNRLKIRYLFFNESGESL